MRRWWREGLWGDFGFIVEDLFEGGGYEPWWGEDICAPLSFEEKGKPER